MWWGGLVLPAASAAFAIMAMRRVQPTTAPRVVAVDWPDTNSRRAWPVPAAAPNFRAAVLPQPHDAITPSRRCRCPGPPPPSHSHRNEGGAGQRGHPRRSTPPPPLHLWFGGGRSVATVAACRQAAFVPAAGPSFTPSPPPPPRFRTPLATFVRAACCVRAASGRLFGGGGQGRLPSGRGARRSLGGLLAIGAVIYAAS